MHSAISFVATFLVNAVWQVALIAGAGWLAARLLRRLGPQAEHIVWVSALIAALIAPVLSILPWLLRSLSLPYPTGLHASIVLTAAGETPHGLGDTWALAELAVRACIALYLGSLLYFSVRLARAWLFAASLLRGASPAPLTSEQAELWARCKQRFLFNEARILCSARISGPVVLGLRRPVLLLPAEFAERCESSDFLAALAHECAHIQRNDVKKNLVYEIASLIASFHPAIWFIKSQIAQTREMACDALVTEMLVEPRRYAHSLLRLAAMVATAPRIAATPAIGIFDAGILKKRIMRISRKGRHAPSVLRYGLTIFSVLLLASAGAFAVAKTVVIEPQPPAAVGPFGNPASNAAYNGPVYKIGNGVTAPVPLNAVEAEFPKSGKSFKKGFNAIVLVGIIVDEKGMPQDLRVVRSYNADFDAEAIKAVNRYRFKPAMHAGEPVAVAITIEVNFKKY
jgi:TonB family protein